MNTEIIKIKSEAPTKEDVQQIASRIAEQVKFNEINALDAYLKLSLIKDIADIALKAISENVHSEMDKWGSDKPIIAGWTIERVNGGNTSKFDNNPEWVRLKSEINEIEKKMKAASKGLTVLDENTGEIIPPAILVPRADSIRISFKK